MNDDDLQVSQLNVARDVRRWIFVTLACAALLGGVALCGWLVLHDLRTNFPAVIEVLPK